jgi:hypothetical protein
VVHTLANVSDAPARYLLACTPAGFERYFDGIAARQTGVEPPPEGLKPSSLSARSLSPGSSRARSMRA